jgi:hypothetical protein
MELYEAPEDFSHMVHYDESKETQVRLTVNTFRGVEYMHVRKYYLDFDETWRPTPHGVAMPLSIENSRELFVGLLKILAESESKELIEEVLGSILKTS